MSLLSVRDLRVDFGALQAVKAVTFDIPEHSTVALVGESGSGKYWVCCRPMPSLTERFCSTAKTCWQLLPARCAPCAAPRSR